MPATTLYPSSSCVATTEKQVYLNGQSYGQNMFNRQQQHQEPNSHEVVVNGIGVATSNNDATSVACIQRQKESFKSIMIIDVLNRLCPQLNDVTTSNNGRGDFHPVTIATTTSTTTTTTTSIKVASPRASFANLTTSNVKRLNSYFMQQNSTSATTVVDKEILKFKNFKDINNKLYSLRQFYENQQQQQQSQQQEGNLFKKITENSDSLNLSSTETRNDNSSGTLNSLKRSSSKCNIIKIDTIESFEEKVVNDLDSILSSMSMHDYKPQAPIIVDDQASTTTSSSSSSSVTDSDQSCRSSENGDANDDYEAATESKFHFELECNAENNNGDGYGKQVKEDFDATVERQDQFETIFNLVLHRLPGENLGIELRVEQDGILKVTHVIPNSAAECASDMSGNSCPIRESDEIIEINGVSLINMTKEEVLSIVKELPLYVTITIRRRDNGSPLPIGIKGPGDLDFSGHVTPTTADIKIPMGFSLHTVYLSSLESKCIMPDDLKECEEIEGLFKMQRNTLQISEEDHLRKGDILYNINGEYYKNKFDIISKLGSLSGIAEVSVLRKNTTNCCYGTTLEEVPYCNSIFAQNSIKLAMRRYETLGIKSSSDADIAYTISERASAEPPILTEIDDHATITNVITQTDDTQACTQTTLLKCDHDDGYETRPRMSEIEVKNKTEIKLTPKANNENSVSSYCDDNWIFYGAGKRVQNNADTTASEKFQRTSSILLNNDFSNNDTNPNTMHITTMDIVPNQTQACGDAGNYYFAEDTTLRTLTNSSCHSDRSLVQLNLVCCELDQEQEKGASSSRISEEEEEDVIEGNSNKAATGMSLLMSPDSIQPHYKCSLNQDSVALKSYSHLPSSSCSSSMDHQFIDSLAVAPTKSYVNSCKIQLLKKECCLDLTEEKAVKSEKKLQEEELSKILQNMINEIEESSRATSRNDDDDCELDRTKIDEEFRKSRTAVLIEKLNAGAIGTVIYQNRVDSDKKEALAAENKTLEIECATKATSKSASTLSSPHHMKNQVQLELLQLVNGTTKGKKSKLASMIKRIQDQGEQEVGAVEPKEDEMATKEEHKQNNCTAFLALPPPPPPLPVSLNDSIKTSFESSTLSLKSKISTTEKNSSSASEKFSSLMCAQPFHLQKGANIKKTFSLQQTSSSLGSQNSVMNTCKLTTKDNTTTTTTTTNPNLAVVKHSVSFSGKSETSINNPEAPSIDYVDSAFEKEIKIQQKIHQTPTYQTSTTVLQQPETPAAEAKSTNTTTTITTTENPASKVSSVKEKIMLFTKAKRPSFHTKRQQSQFVVDNLNNAVISRKPSYTKVTVSSFSHSTTNQPTQLILPDLGMSKATAELKLTPKHKPLQRSSPRNSCEKEINSPIKATLATTTTATITTMTTTTTTAIATTTSATLTATTITTTSTLRKEMQEFKSVRDRVAYFSSKVHENHIESPTPNLHSLARTIAPVVTTTTMSSSSSYSTSITPCIVTSTTSSLKTSVKPSTTTITTHYYVSKANNNNTTGTSQQERETTPSPLHINKLNTASSTNICKYSNANDNTSSNSSLNKGGVTSSSNSSSNKNAMKLEVKNILISHANENKISELIQKFTKRK